MINSLLWDKTLKRLVFMLPPERAHYVSMGIYSNMVRPRPVAKLVERTFDVADDRLFTTVAGLNFKNPVGLAAGFDKDARWYNQLFNLGFSHVEVGTITALAQAGNEKPRLFRLPKDKAVINRMGFNNAGAEAAAKSLSSSRTLNNHENSGPDRPGSADQFRPLLGINIGKSKLTALEDAVGDYLKSFELLRPYADYLTLNVSSPNTPGLRKLQERGPLLELLEAIRNANTAYQDTAADGELPIFLKIAPDVSDGELADIAEIAVEAKIAGVIATNTTIDRGGLTTPAVDKFGAGGVSGKPLTQPARLVVSQLHELLPAEIPIIGVGGIMSGEDAWNMILAGASLIQVYTGFVYSGPAFVKNINQFLVKKLETEGFTTISEAVGKRSW